MKKLYRTKHDRVFAGILGGVGNYFAVDPVLLRVLFVIFVVFTGIFPGVIGYLFCIFIIPEEPASVSTH